MMMKLWFILGPVVLCNEYKQRKAFKKELSKELMFLAWHPARWWDWCVSGEQKKKTEPIYLGKVV